MMPAVSDSGPFLYLAMLHHVDLLLHYFQPLLTLPQVYNEVVTQGSGRPSAHELTTMCERGEVSLVEINAPRLVEQLRHASSRTPSLSDVDVIVVSLAIEQRILS